MNLFEIILNHNRINRFIFLSLIISSLSFDCGTSN